jgi:hypothetical protein
MSKEETTKQIQAAFAAPAIPREPAPSGRSAPSCSPELERLMARNDMIENLYKKMEDSLPCQPMSDEMLARMCESLGLEKGRDYRPYCVRQGCEYMPRMFRVKEGFRCWSCNNVWDLTNKENEES